MFDTLHTPARAAALGVLAGIALMASGCSKEPSADKISADDMSEGSADAKVTVIEYASVACPICARVNQDLMPKFKAKYVDTKLVRYVYRPMLTGNPQVAAAGHMLANCVAKDKRFVVIDAIMRSQGRMDEGGPQEQYVNARPVLVGIAQSAGLSEDAFNKCVTDPKGLEHMNDLAEQYHKLGVDATPTFFVNGKKMELIKGDITDFDDAIQPELKKK